MTTERSSSGGASSLSPATSPPLTSSVRKGSIALGGTPTLSRLPAIGSSRLPTSGEGSPAELSQGSPPSPTTPITTAAAAAVAASASGALSGQDAGMTRAIRSLLGAGTQNASVESVEMALLELLAMIPLSSESIWEGDAELFPVLYQFKDSFIRLGNRPGEDATTNNVLAFNLPSSDFPTQRKRFRVNRNLPTSALVSLLCTKLGVPDPGRFCLYSLKGFRFNPEEPLSSYGFGTLFKNWHVNVARIRERNKVSLVPPVSCSDGEALMIAFPPLLELIGLQKKTSRLTREELNIPVHDLLRHLLTKLGLPGSERFTLLVPDERGGESVVLAPEQSLRNCGLGWRFHGLEAKLVFRALAQTDTTRSTMRFFPWIDFPKATPTTEEVTEACRVLDARLVAAEQEKKELREREARAKERIAELESELDTRRRKSADTEEFDSKLAGLSEALGKMEERLLATESELGSATSDRAELAAAAERANELEDRLDELLGTHQRVVGMLRTLQGLYDGLKMRHEKLEAEYAQQAEEAERTTVRHEAVLSYACRMKSALDTARRTGAAPASESPELLQELETLAQANKQLAYENRAVAEENAKLRAQLAALQTAPQVCQQVTEPSAVAAATAKAQEIARSRAQQLQLQQARMSSRRTSAPVSLQFVTELSQMRERIRATMLLTKEYRLNAPSPRAAPGTATPSTVAPAAKAVLDLPMPTSAPPIPTATATGSPDGRSKSIPTSVAESLTLLAKINDQKEKMLLAARSFKSRDPGAALESQVPTRDSIAITASSMYAAIARKMTESQLDLQPDEELEKPKQ